MLIVPALPLLNSILFLMSERLCAVCYLEGVMVRLHWFINPSSAQTLLKRSCQIAIAPLGEHHPITALMLKLEVHVAYKQITMGL